LRLAWKGDLVQEPGSGDLGRRRRRRVSTVAVIVFIVVAVLLLAMLVAAGRKAAQARTAHESGHADDPRESRSHAEASRCGDAERL
jgi:hypothetical protein